MICSYCQSEILPGQKIGGLSGSHFSRQDCNHVFNSRIERLRALLDVAKDALDLANREGYTATVARAQALIEDELKPPVVIQE